jgi:hypothetical protein
MDRAKLESCVRALRADLQRVEDRCDALEALLNEEQTPQAIANNLVTEFAKRWRVRYGKGYLCTNRGAAIAQMKRLLRELALPEIERRMDAYFGDREKFLVDNRHPIGMFSARINHYATDGLDFSGPVGCTHQPRCASDAEHTQRRAREMRA